MNAIGFYLIDPFVNAIILPYDYFINLDIIYLKKL